jgi:hypothetical protein
MKTNHILLKLNITEDNANRAATTIQVKTKILNSHYFSKQLVTKILILFLLIIHYSEELYRFFFF